MADIDFSKVRIRSMPDIRPAAINFRNLALELGGLRIAASHNIASRIAMADQEGALLATSVFGWKDAVDRWWEDKRFALSNPLSEACRIEGRPFWANRYGAWNEEGEPVLQHLDLSYYGAISSNLASIVFPVHLPFSQIGLVSLSCVDGVRDNLLDVFRRYYSEYLTLSHIFISDYAQLHQTDKWLPQPCKLTKYEIGCLRWASRGKTDEEIAVILNRARPTIRFHLQNAATKLGAANRSQAVFRAGQLGYLTPASPPPHVH